MAGNKKTKYMAGGGKSSKYKAAGGIIPSGGIGSGTGGGGKSGIKRARTGGKFMGGGGTERGKEAKVQTYKEYVQKMFGGGITGTKGRAMGGRQDKRP